MPMYENTNRLVEKISVILYVGLVKVLPTCVIWSQFMICLVKYFATDLNGAAFELVVPLWYVGLFFLMNSNFDRQMPTLGYPCFSD